MKHIRKTALVFFTLVTAIFLLVYCQHDDQLIEPGNNNLGPNVLLAKKVSAAPVMDGTIDALWENAPRLEFETAVPDPSGDVFRGFVGNVIPYVSLRCVYDTDNIYFLAEWDDPTESLLRNPWYFDPATKLWAQEASAPTFSSSGTVTRKGFYEDKISLLWNIDNSVSGWNSGTCFRSCHTNLNPADGSARHHTNNSGERIDMWHWKSVRAGVDPGQFDDQYQDNTYPNGRKSDTGKGAYTDNKQTLTVTGSAATVSVPKYVIPNRNKNYWILQAEIDGGAAKQVTAVDANGVLTLSDGTVIDPNTDAAYQRNGATVGDKFVSGILISSYDQSRGDITCKSRYTGTGWVLEFTRKLNTGDAERKDVNFASLDDQYFGFAIFENAQIAHSIKANLLLKFEK